MEERNQLILEYVKLCGEQQLEPGHDHRSRLAQIEQELNLSAEEILQEGRALLLAWVVEH